VNRAHGLSGETLRGVRTESTIVDDVRAWRDAMLEVPPRYGKTHAMKPRQPFTLDGPPISRNMSKGDLMRRAIRAEAEIERLQANHDAWKQITMTLLRAAFDLNAWEVEQFTAPPVELVAERNPTVDEAVRAWWRRARQLKTHEDIGAFIATTQTEAR